MIEKLQNEIGVEKEVLSTLPKNNKKNIKKYKDDISEKLTKYKEKLDAVKKEMLSRKETISNKLPKENIKNNEEALNKVLNECHWFSNYNTSYEKMELDKILYNMNKDKITYEGINKIIFDLIEKYKEAGINLKASDFSYSPIFYQYMKAFFNNIKDLNNKELTDAFEKLYWKESNIINHIELTFKSLYYKYQKSLDEYCSIKQQKLAKDYNNSIVKKYQTLKIENDIQDTSIVNIYNKFVTKELNPSDFTKEKIDKVMSNYIDIIKVNENNYETVIKEFVKLKHTLQEYSYLLKYNYIIEDLKKLYAEKDKYKGVVKTKQADIKKSEKKIEDSAKKVYLLNKEKDIKLGLLYKITKAMWASKNRKNKDEVIDSLYMTIDNQIIETKALYDELEMDKFNEKLMAFTDNNEIISLLKLANSYYIYQDKVTENQEFDTEEAIKEVNEFIMNPYNNLINNINIENNKDIKQIISDKYELSSINIPAETLEDVTTIEQVISDIDKMVYYNVISKSNLSVEEIIYVYTVDNILN